MTMTWDEHYEIAKQYYEENGNLNVPIKTKLYTWLSAQRYAKRGKRGKLTAEQVTLLEQIGMEWESHRNCTWMWYFQHANDYYKIHGALNVPISYVTKDGCKLGQWITRQRQAYKCRNRKEEKGKHRLLISENEVRMLEDIGMQWDITWLGRRNSIPEIMVYYYIKKYFPDAMKLSAGDFLNVEIDIYIPSLKYGIEYDGYEWHKNKKERDEKKGKICKKNDIKLVRIRERGLAAIENCDKTFYVDSGNYVQLQKVIEEILCDFNVTDAACDIEKDYFDIVSVYKNYSNHQWDFIYEMLKKRYQKDGFLEIKPGEMSEAGINLYNWLCKQRGEYREGKMTKEHIKKLKKISVSLNPTEETWEAWLGGMNAYHRQYGDLNIPISYIDSNGMALGKWLSHQRESYRSGTLAENKMKQLEALDVLWNPMQDMEQVKKDLLVKYYDEYGSINMPMHTVYQGIPIWEWLQGKKKKYVKGKLSKKEIEFFETYGIIWDVFDERWQAAYNSAKRYYEKHGNLFIPVDYVSDDGVNLQSWILHQRGKYKKGKLTQSQIQKLDEIEMCWNWYDQKWMENYSYLKKYYDEYGNIDIPSNFMYCERKLGMWLSTQRQAYRGNPNYHITEERIVLLNQLGMDWKEKIT